MWVGRITTSVPSTPQPGCATCQMPVTLRRVLLMKDELSESGQMTLPGTGTEANTYEGMD